MLSGRFGHKLNNEVFDTKMLIQLYYLPLIQKLAETDTKYQEMINSIGISARDNGLLSSSLSKIGPALGLNMSGYHDALTDVKITIEMVRKIVDFLKENQSVDIMKYQTDRIKVIRG
jgi:predicted histidine transporter YuiF (NhaC family)